MDVLTTMANESSSNLPNSPECQSILHIGAHRTGTTLFQEFLYRRRNAALDRRIRFIETVECRRDGLLDGIIYNRTDDKIYLRDRQKRLRDNLTSSLDENMRLILSDENILGTMQKCAKMGSLYPDAYEMVSRLGSSLEVFDTVLISIRPLHKWWLSVQGFFRKSEQTVEPNKMPVQTKEILEGRAWSNVVQDIKSAVGSHKTIIVRDFDYHLPNPKRQLLKVSKWNDIKEIPGMEERVANASLPISLVSNADAHSQPQSVAGFESTFAFQEQITELNEFYLKDLREIKKIIGKNGRILCEKL